MSASKKNENENFNDLGKLKNSSYPVRSKFKKRKLSLFEMIKKAVKFWQG